MKSTRLPPELQAAWEEIEEHAKAYGLDFYPIIYEVLKQSPGDKPTNDAFADLANGLKNGAVR